MYFEAHNCGIICKSIYRDFIFQGDDNESRFFIYENTCKVLILYSKISVIEPNDYLERICVNTNTNQGTNQSGVLLFKWTKNH